MNMCHHLDCNKHYCGVEVDAKTHRENQNKLMPSDGAPEFGVWKDTKYVHKETRLFYCGIVLYLKPDGTYELGDTTG